LAFQSIELAKGETKTVTLAFEQSMIQPKDELGGPILEGPKTQLIVAPHAPMKGKWSEAKQLSRSITTN
jgi:hypothetical protein